MRTLLACLVALPLLALGSCGPRVEETRTPPAATPRLVVFVVIDQGRADYFERFRPYFSHGLRKLLDESIDFAHTSHLHALTKTAPGHATIVTGVYPARHGIIGNDWYDRKSGAVVKADEDSAYEPERAPTRMLATSFGDWLKSDYPQSRVFSASIKSRAAVTSGGRSADGAFWFDDDTGRFVSSDYYPVSSPPWLEAFNRNRLPKRLFGTSWEPLVATGAAALELGLETVDRGILRRQLPRPVGPAETVPDEGYYSEFRNESPFPDRYLGEFATALLDNEELGRDEFPDLLALSFSSLDYIGHRYGPNSPEVLDTLMRLDETLGRIFDHLDTTIGLEHVVVTLTSDHGAPQVPEYASGRRFWLDERKCLQRVEGSLDTSFGPADWLEADLVFDRNVLAERKVELAKVSEVLADALLECPGIGGVWTAERLDRAGDDSIASLYRNSFHPERSPDLQLQNEAGSVMTHNETDHGSPYDYDRRVPWLLRLPSAQARVLEEPVATVDIAPTVASFVGLSMPHDLDGSSRLGMVTDTRLPSASKTKDH